MRHMQRMCKIISPRVRFYIVKVLFEQFMRYHFVFLSCKPMIKYWVTLQVKDWDIILVLGLEILNCHSKGPYMIFVIFSPRTTFWPYVVSTQKVRKLRQNRFRDNSVNCNKTDFARKQSKKGLISKLFYQFTRLDMPELTSHEIKLISPHPKCLHM